MKTLNLVPYLGRDYRSRGEVLQAWAADRDFEISDFFSRWDGKPTNKADCERDNVVLVSVRYGKRRKVVMIENKSSEGWVLR